MMRVIRSACSTITFALPLTSSPSTSPRAIILARASTTLSGVPSSWAMPEARVPSVARRVTCSSCCCAATMSISASTERGSKLTGSFIPRAR